MTESMTTLTQDTRVLLEVGDAMTELVATYAVYPMPDGTGPAHVQGITGKRSIARARRDAMHRDSKLTWADQLAATYLEVLAEPGPGALHDRLLKLAATATCWASDLDRRHAGDPAYDAARVNRVLVQPPDARTETP